MEFAEGAPCWADAALPDVESGKRFYGDLFGWTFDEGAGAEYGYYTQAYSGGRSVAALAPDRDGRTPTGWTVYFKARDAETLASAVRDAGGRLLVEPLSIGPFGTMALAADPEGTVFGLWQPGTHIGFEVQGEPGTFRRTELHARDRATVAPFYASVLGHGATDLGSSIATGDAPAHFLVHFAVTDCEATADAATRLGGRVEEEPFDTAYGRVAVLTDNQGAAFALHQG
ncbi:VOC family protein [Streptomyces sp. NBC_01003]|uniref:VOC family protein n=1 Tax=Streptomyces sp. NBC_01003 TaxID=2903714 RepID=UPI00386F16B0|nr:VOC family protein [Streptomyces sp. NBC_01003]